MTRPGWKCLPSKTDGVSGFSEDRMSGRMLKRWIAAALCACSLSFSHASPAREPPAAGCIDLHDLTGGWRTGERELLLRSSGKAGARLELDAACPVFAESVDLETFAAGGWACPGERVLVRGGGITCPVIRMTALSEAELAESLRLRDARMRASVMLDRVVVQGRRWRDVRGTTDRCVDARFLRGWHWDGEGLVVEVSPPRHSGNRYYRVETVEHCSDLASAHSIRLVSRSGGAAVCGRPGDRVVLMGYSSAGLVPMGVPPSGAFGRGCEVSRVTPLPRE